VVGQLIMAGVSDLVLGLGQLLWLPAMILTALQFGRAPREAMADAQGVHAAG
jgi:hypothetical protein